MTVLAADVLHTIEHYVQVHRARIMHWVIDQPILKMCRLAGRRRGTTPRLYWWEQPMDLDKASAGTPADATTEGDRGDGTRPLGHSIGPSPLPRAPIGIQQGTTPMHCRSPHYRQQHPIPHHHQVSTRSHFQGQVQMLSSVPWRSPPPDHQWQ